MAYALHTLNYTDNVTEGNATAIDVGGTPDFYQIIANGTFGSGTITAYLSVDGGSNYYTTGETLTADGIITLNVKSGDKIKVVLSGATNPDIDIQVR